MLRGMDGFNLWEMALVTLFIFLCVLGAMSVVSLALVVLGLISDGLIWLWERLERLWRKE